MDRPDGGQEGSMVVNMAPEPGGKSADDNDVLPARDELADHRRSRDLVGQQQSTGGLGVGDRQGLVLQPHARD
jgi:hypothetical protein